MYQPLATGIVDTDLAQIVYTSTYLLSHQPEDGHVS